MADRKLEIVIEAKDRASSVLRGIGDVAKTAIGVAIGQYAIPAVKALASELGSYVTEAMNAEDIQAKLNAVLESTGGVAGVTADAANELAESISLVTKFDDEAVVSAESLMLTFTNIGKDTFPQAITAATDMATVLGTDLDSTVRQLGRALNDPVQGLSALTRMGVQFSAEQEEVIKAMVETGDVAGAQAIILDQLAVKFGGAAEAAGQTAAGQFAIFRTQLGNIKETIGAALLPALTQLAGKLAEALANPAVQAAIAAIVETLAGMATQVGDIVALLLQGDVQGALTAAFGPDVAATIERIAGQVATLAQELAAVITEQVVPFVEQHWPAIQAALIALGALLVGAQVMGAIGAVAGAIAALANPITLVIAAVALLAAAWTEDWGGIRTTITAWWESTGRPIFEQLVAWLQVNIPLAIQTLTAFWTGTLQPALAAVWAWITTSLIPTLTDVWTWLGTNIPLAISTVSEFWTGTLQPALATVWAFITETLIPTFVDVYTWLSDTLSTATQALSDLWTGTLQPALKAVWDFISVYIIPLFDALANVWIALVKVEAALLAKVWTDTVKPALDSIWKFIKDNLQPILDTLANKFLKAVSHAFDDLATFARDTLRPALDKVLDIFIKIAGYIYNRLQDALGVLSGIANGVASAIGAITSAAQDAYNWLTNLANRITNMPSYNSQAGGGGGGGGGARAAGGPVNMGGAYLVGEEGPELFVPRRNGLIVPNERLGGPTWNVTINTSESTGGVLGTIRYLQALGASA